MLLEVLSRCSLFNKCMYMYAVMHLSIYVYIYIYIEMYKWVDREKMMKTICVYIYVDNTHTY